VAWFAEKYPDKEFIGIDISKEMIALATKRINSASLANANALQCDETQMTETFSGKKFDLIYVYFGALNTVSNLHKTAEDIYSLLTPGGHAVLTFVNKWYLREMLVQTAKLKFNIAFARLKKVWGGYSPDRYLPSRCYSPKQITKAFKEFELLARKGYSIYYPAWYNYKKFLNNPKRLDALWEKDQRIQNSALWSKGEYTLFVFRRESSEL
jgi:ubiquinone/menaquinone biosynthesis C-methylase UbiE